MTAHDPRSILLARYSDIPKCREEAMSADMAKVEKRGTEVPGVPIAEDDHEGFEAAVIISEALPGLVTQRG
jgi:hypothetical protein